MAQSPLDLLEDGHGDLAHVLAFDFDHRVGETLDDLLLLRLREDALEGLDLDEWHVVSSLVGRFVVSAMVRSAGTAHIGQVP